MYQSRDPQALEICPYNTAHRIIRSRMSTHIVKCRKANQGESSMTVCLFNANHNVPETELQYHLENCADRFNLDKHVLVSKDANLAKYPVENNQVADEESWDNENCQSYNPAEYCKKNPILRQAKVESAAVRKTFRNEERQRIQKIRDAKPSDVEPSTSETSSQHTFRTTALANTTTTFTENGAYDDIERKMKESSLKPIVQNPNHKPTFVRFTVEKSVETESTSNLEETDCEGAVGYTAPSKLDPEETQKEESFVLQKSKKKAGRGRGRAVKH